MSAIGRGEFFEHLKIRAGTLRGGRAKTKRDREQHCRKRPSAEGADFRTTALRVEARASGDHARKTEETVKHKWESFFPPNSFTVCPRSGGKARIQI